MDEAHLEVCPVLYMLFMHILYMYTIYKQSVHNNEDWQIEKKINKIYLTWYSLLNPVFSFKDMFVICAFIFLTEMFLLVGGPLFVFSGKAYVDSSTSFASKMLNQQYTVALFFGQ